MGWMGVGGWWRLGGCGWVGGWGGWMGWVGCLAELCDNNANLTVAASYR